MWNLKEEKIVTGYTVIKEKSFSGKIPQRYSLIAGQFRSGTM
jgi:hypothetical protein